jgi:hypothetical protein
VKDADRQLLEELLAATDDEDEERRFNPRPFREMLERGYNLTDKQRAWLLDMHERIVGTPHYANIGHAVSEGREVIHHNHLPGPGKCTLVCPAYNAKGPTSYAPTQSMLPKKPPSRRIEE